MLDPGRREKGPMEDGNPASGPAWPERERYRELLEELRTILPGVQVLFAFLLIAPFSTRFGELDAFGRGLYSAALVGATLAMLVFLAPASNHRIHPRAERHARVQSAIRFMVVGMLVLAASVLVVVFVVLRFIFDAGVAGAAVAPLTLTVLVLWYVLPTVRRLRGL
jgi:hypothetical protein